MKKVLLLAFALLITSFSFSQKVNFKKLDAYIEKAVKDFDQPGLAVGIVKDGELVWSNGYGKLDLAKDDLVDPNSIFFIASMSKAFTACAVGLLVDDGKLNWNDPVVKHMSWFQTPDPWVTEHMVVKDLLCHRSGWITFDGDLLWYGADYDQREILERHSKEPTTYEFRNGYGYSNLMFIAAAQLIEEVSGKTWNEFIAERILAPLDMKRTTVTTADLTNFENVALPHVRKGQEAGTPQKSMAYQSLVGADGATGINSCITDLAKWDAMWANEGLVGDSAFISERTWVTITTSINSFPVRPVDATEGKHYSGAALGWFTEDMYGVKVIDHSGGMPGFILNHVVVPEKDLAVIALGNGESYSVFAATSKILDLYLGEDDTDPATKYLGYMQRGAERNATRRAERIESRIEGTSPSYENSAYVGSYLDKIYGSASVSEEARSLVMSLDPAAELFTGKLVHWHHDTWQWQHNDPFLEFGYVTFYFNADHKIEGFKIDQHSPDFHFYKLDLVRQ